MIDFFHKIDLESSAESESKKKIQRLTKRRYSPIEDENDVVDCLKPCDLRLSGILCEDFADFE